MNKFATIKRVRIFKKVAYYTVHFDEEEHNEFEKFILNHQNKLEIHNEYNDMLSLIERIGDETGALKRYFSRHERKSEALPPEWDELTPYERRLHVKWNHNLRLYCMRISDEMVFLFNGGVKTPGPITAEQCNVVRKYFRMANKLSQKIDEAMKDGEINIEGKRVSIEEGFEIIV